MSLLNVFSFYWGVYGHTISACDADKDHNLTKTSSIAKRLIGWHFCIFGLVINRTACTAAYRGLFWTSHVATQIVMPDPWVHICKQHHGAEPMTSQSIEKLGTAIAVVTALLAGSASAEIIKFHHDLPEDSAQHRGAERFRTLVEDRSDGAYTVEIYANNALGNDVEVAQQMQFGAVQAAPIPTAKLSNFNPSLQLIDLPFLFPSVEATYKVLDAPTVGGELLNGLADAGFVGAAFWESGFKQLTCNHPVTKPSDYDGQRVRVMESPLLIAQFESMGATAIPIAFTEVYSALQQGVVDCQENPIVSINSMKFYEVQDYMMISNHGYLGTAFIFSKVWFDQQSADDQEMLLTAAREAGDYQREQSIADADSLLEKIANAGTTEIIELTPEQLEVFADAMKPVHEAFADRIGRDLLDAAYAEVEAATASQ
jgi:C4-dicarboxylate-binding protein DctP